MKKSWIISAGCLLGGLLVGFPLGLATAKVLATHRTPGNQAAIAVVNGDPITLEELHTRLKADYGAQGLRKLAEERLILREAGEQKVALTPEEETAIAEVMKNVRPDPMLQKSVEQRLRSQSLWRKLLLKKVSDQDVQQTYDLFSEELRRYQLHAIFLPNRADLEEIQRDLQRKVPFDQLARTYSMERSTSRFGGVLGWLTLGDVERTLGTEARDKVEALKVGGITSPFYTPRGIVILKLGKVASSQDELRPFILDMLANVRQTAELQAVVKRSKIVSPLLQNSPAGADEIATPLPGAEATPSQP